ncbi:hypothetical protein C8Q77DRAFT_368413 [Trametes polyzona]|nr:hypothetical protein C8Q77DRAFT_368413 [Trametes polyzona]
MSQFTGLNATAGAGLIGVFISTGMYGWTTLQTTHYFDSSWSKDSRWMKAYIAFIWACQTAHTYLLCASVYHAVITDIVLGDAAGWEVTRKQDDCITAVTGLIILWHFALELLVVLLTMQYPDFAQFHNITAYYTGSLAVAALDDLMIAAALCYFLYTQRTGLKGADTLIKRVIRYSIMTGAVTSIVDVIILICFIAMPDNLVYLTLSYPWRLRCARTPSHPHFQSRISDVASLRATLKPGRPMKPIQ